MTLQSLITKLHKDRLSLLFPLLYEKHCAPILHNLLAAYKNAQLDFKEKLLKHRLNKLSPSIIKNYKHENNYGESLKFIE